MKKSLSGILFLALCVAVASAATITVTKPAAGETVAVGHGYTIMWTKTGTMGSQVRITLRNASTLAEVKVVADPAPNSGSFAWQMPGDVPVGSYRIRVKVKNEDVVGDSGSFDIEAGPAVIKLPPVDRRAPDVLKFPALSIYQAGMVPYDDKFEVTFGYKNTGSGPLPKNSDMPVKPNFRVIVDGKEVNRGSLTIPAFPAPPGWEMPTFFACELNRQTSGPFDPTTFVGNQLRININENKVNGMAPDSQTYSLRTMALNYAYDILINDVTVDWNTGLITTLVRLEGVFQPNDEIHLWDDNVIHYPGYPYWHADAKAVAGQHLYTLATKRDNIKSLNELNLALNVSLSRSSDPKLIYKDVDHRNNSYKRVFRR